MLQEKYLPDFHFNEKHSIQISASPGRVSNLMTKLDVSSSWIIRILLTLRGIPRKTSFGIERWKKMGFQILEQQEGREIILGLIGQFWKPSGNIHRFEVNEFVGFKSDQFAKATWNFEIIPMGESRIVVETETRIQCANDNVRKNFGRYWFFIKPFSGLIRMEILKIVKKKAEQSS